MSRMKPHVILFVAAPLILAAGGFAFFSAPPEANKMTAVIIPSFIAIIFIVLGVISLIRRAAWVRWAGVAVCLAFAGLVAFPAVMRTGKMRNWPEANTAWQAATAADPTLGPRAASDRAVRKAFFDERSSPDHDQTYLLITLWSIVGVCALSGLLVGASSSAPRPRS